MQQARMWLAVVSGDGADAFPVAICRDPLVVRLALMRGRAELDRELTDRPERVADQLPDTDGAS